MSCMKTQISIFSLLISTSFLMSQVTLTETIEHDGLTRSYNIYIPSGYEFSDQKFPLLFCFHGFTSSADVIMAYSGFNALAEENEFIVVYPQGTLFSGLAHWNVGGFTEGSTVDDIGFVDVLLDDLMDNYQLDEERIYSTGMSNGGYMSFLLACQLSDRIAAIASVTGSMTIETYNDCNPMRPVPVLQIHGDADDVVAYDGLPFSKAIPEVLDYWVANNECETTAMTMELEDINTTDNSTVSTLDFPNGLQCTSVNHFRVHGGGHTWPGVWGNLDISASDEVWNFVSQYNLNGLIGCTTATEEAEDIMPTLKIYPNPSADFININSTQAQSYFIYNKAGQVIISGQAKNKIDISQLEAGLYFLEIDGQLQKLIKAEK